MASSDVMAITKWAVQAPSSKESPASWRGGAEGYYSDTLRGRVMRASSFRAKSNSDRGDGSVFEMSQQSNFRNRAVVKKAGDRYRIGICARNSIIRQP